MQEAEEAEAMQEEAEATRKMWKASISKLVYNTASYTPLI